ncbi:EsaB/YukD family protein [Nocardioides sp. zg-DK7169]|uniref:EsaB/YukD family protein n=1 Tax=Nocardioides sp. zg-DK7169 TaxID=2736600 RepID=UPI0034647262
MTVASATRRVDLVLPGAVPVAELLPELARCVGLLDARSAAGGHRLTTATGRPLSGATGLRGQGVEDGALLTVVAGVAEPPPPRHDDLTEAVLAVVEGESPRRGSGVPRSSLLAGPLVLLLGAAALLGHDDPPLAGAGATGVAVGLLGGAVVASRGRRGSALAALWSAVAYAVVAGALLAPQLAVPALSGAAAAAASAGAAGLLGLRAGRAWAVVPLAGGLGCLAGIQTHRVLGVEPGVVAAVLLVLAVLATGLLPRWALGLVGVGVDALGPPDPGRVREDVRAAQELLLVLSVAIGLAVVALAPVAVSLGTAGTTLAVASCLVVLLRGRHHRHRAGALAATTLGVAGLLGTAVAVLVLHPGWRTETALALLATGVGTLVVDAVPAGPVRRGRVGDLVETAALLSLLPVLAVAAGLPRVLGA